MPHCFSSSARFASNPSPSSAVLISLSRLVPPLRFQIARTRHPQVPRHHPPPSPTQTLAPSHSSLSGLSLAKARPLSAGPALCQTYAATESSCSLDDVSISVACLAQGATSLSCSTGEGPPPSRAVELGNSIVQVVAQPHDFVSLRSLFHLCKIDHLRSRAYCWNISLLSSPEFRVYAASSLHNDSLPSQNTLVALKRQYAPTTSNCFSHTECRIFGRNLCVVRFPDFWRRLPPILIS